MFAKMVEYIAETHLKPHKTEDKLKKDHMHTFSLLFHDFY